MADHSNIEWTDATWNPITGCTVHSAGCTNCYAMKLAGTRMKHHPSRAGLTRDTKAGPVWTGEVRMNWDWLEQPLAWARPRDVFVCAHADLFHEGVELDWIAQIFGVAIAAVHLRKHRFQILTKRSSRMRELLASEEFWELANSYAGQHVMDRVDPLDRRSDDARATLDDYGPDNPPPGIWLGVSVEDQRAADERIPDLLATPAAVRWLSCEPLIGPVDLEHVAAEPDPIATDDDWKLHVLLAGTSFEARGSDGYWYDADGPEHPALDWVIVGGESGPGARPMHPDWARSLRDQCAAAGVPFLFKQWGEWKPTWGSESHLLYSDGRMVAGTHDHPDAWKHKIAEPIWRAGKKAAGRLLDGVQHDGVPVHV